MGFRYFVEISDGISSEASAEKPNEREERSDIWHSGLDREQQSTIKACVCGEDYYFESRLCYGRPHYGLPSIYAMPLCHVKYIYMFATMIFYAYKMMMSDMWKGCTMYQSLCFQSSSKTAEGGHILCGVENRGKSNTHKHSSRTFSFIHSQSDSKSRKW